jgi:hypothetical protein
LSFAQEATPESSPPPAAAASQQDPLIREAASAALDFTRTLPNYVCQEAVTHYGPGASNLPAHGTVAPTRPIESTAEVVYEDGKEDYRNITVGGKPSKDAIVWSTGEFGTILVNLFKAGAAAQFRYLKDSRTGGFAAREYEFKVTHENSHWEVKFGPRSYTPGYTGKVWIDPATARVLRIEMAARDFPVDFGADRVELSTDYGYVRLGGAEPYLLPVHSENVLCRQADCARNVIDFRNYKKFEGQSTITFGDPK